MHPRSADMLVAMVDLPSVSVSVADEMSRKVRKPYTITKSRESWTEQEHDKFLEALQLFDRDWKKIEAFVGSKTVIQIRSHAQKYFLKVQKSGTGERVPPPRPKRKSAQPYPQKASRTALVTQQVGRAVMPTSQSESPYLTGLQLCTGIPVSDPAMTAWVHHMAPPQAATGVLANGGSATEFGPTVPRRQMDRNEENLPFKFQQGSDNTSLRAMPDFGEVYSFIGGVFDSSRDDHLKKMQEMAPIDKETVLLLMRNLSINLSSPDMEENMLFLSGCGTDPEIFPTGMECDMMNKQGAPVVAFAPHLVIGGKALDSGHEELGYLTISRDLGEEVDLPGHAFGMLEDAHHCSAIVLANGTGNVPKLLLNTQPSQFQCESKLPIRFEESEAIESVDDGEDVDVWWS